MAVSAVGSAACQNNFFRITSDSDMEKSVTPALLATTGIGPTYLGDISGNMERVDYRIDSEKRMFLLDSTLEARARLLRAFSIPVFPEARKFIRLPASDEQTRGFPITALDTSKPWQSARLYDVGMCSSLAPLDFPLQSLVALIPQGIHAEMVENENIEDPVLCEWGVEPVLRMDVDDLGREQGGVMRVDADALRVSMTVQASEIKRVEGLIDAPCRNAQLDIDFTLVLEVVHRVAVDNTACLDSPLAWMCPGHNLADQEPYTDVLVDPATGAPLSVSLDENGQLCVANSCIQCFYVGDHPDIGAVRPRLLGPNVVLTQFDDGRCGPVAEDQISKVVANEIANQLRTAVERELSEAMLHADIAGFQGETCRADCDCVRPGGGWPANARPPLGV
jgi:hypothetical protein